MGSVSDGNGRNVYGSPAFVTTRWSVVLAAGASGSPDTQRALAILCETYWHPLYSFARKRGYSVEDAKDLTQGFFARFLEKNDVQDANQNRGRFRNFLLTSFKHFASNERDRWNAQKRGGQIELLNLDVVLAEGKFSAEFAQAKTPEQAYEKQWALTLLDETISSLSREYEAAGKSVYFDHLQMYLPGVISTRTYRETAELLATEEASIRVAVHRLRGRYGKLFRQRIADTLENTDDIEEEIRYLLGVLGD